MERPLEIKAGKMIMEGVQVRPDPRKGWLRVVTDPNRLAHVQWLERFTRTIEDDIIVLPGEAVFEKVQQSTGRVYILKFNNDDRKFFFWLQEPKTMSDEIRCAAVHTRINRPVEEEGESEDHEHVPLTTTVETGKATPSGGAVENAARNPPVQLAELQQILANLGQSLGGSSTAFQDPGPSLTEVLKPDNVIPLLKNFNKWEERLAQYLPEGHWTPETLGELMQSPPFRQQLDTFTLALRSGQMDLQQFGIDPTQCDFTVASFLEAIQNQVAAATKVDNVDGDEAEEKQDAEDMDE